MGEITHAGAAILLLDRDAVEAERAHFGPQLDRETVVLVDLGGNERDLLVGEIAHAISQHVDLGAEIMIERGEPGVLHPAIMPVRPDLDEGRAKNLLFRRVALRPGWSNEKHNG